ncbi:MAG TPA: xanthine dehydrogenase family protein molybdopterin-binding subunit [Stellaceae bacterium]|nr:xanthine dehydrogenase family protein molybdopterin-binding subunit [Stellaceae bacterium]
MDGDPATTLPLDGDLAGIALGAIGQPMRRKEDRRLVTGEGRFSDDFTLPGQAYAAIVRSPHPHARIVAIDTARAAAMPGVLAVLTGADALADGLNPVPHDPVPKTRYDMKLAPPPGSELFIGPQFLMQADVVRHVGEAVAMTVAETQAQALDAAEAVAVEYAELPWVTDPRAALRPGAPAVWTECPGNVFIDTKFGDWDATERAFAQADHVVVLDTHIARVTGVPMEPRAGLGEYDKATGRYTVYAGSGGAVRQKRELATILGVAPDKVRVVSLDVGGNFGTRNRVYPETGLVAWAAKRIGRPVKYLSTRSEVFLTDFQGRDLLTRVELALRKDGKFLALRADNVSNCGAHCASLSPLSKGSGLVTGSYAIPVAALRSRAVFTNTMPTNAYRSSGRPEVTFAIEQVIDKAAATLGFDRVELRRMNIVAPEAMPYPNAVGMIYDSGTYEANLDLSMRIHDWPGFAERQREAAARGKLLGLGLAHYVESAIGAPNERTDIAVTAQGRVRVVIGTGPSGQGHETSFAQVVGALMCVPPSSIDLITGDTDQVAVGGGSHSGRSMRHAATLFVKAAPELVAKGKALAAELLGTSASDIAFADGRFSAPASNRSFDYLELGREGAARGLAPIAVTAEHEMHDPVFPNGCAACEVEVDPETGWVDLTRYSVVDDVGRCINPLIVHGQTHGGAAQGIGQALWEECATDPRSGQPLSGSFMDYGMPRADNIPRFETRIVEVLSPRNPLGIKAGGEGGTTPAPSVIVSAILDALRPLGVTDLKMPATPFRVWQAIRAARNH